MQVGDNLTGYSYGVHYWPTYPRHPGCPGRVVICPDCGQSYHPTWPYTPGITWGTTGTASIPGSVPVSTPVSLNGAHACA